MTEIANVSSSGWNAHNKISKITNNCRVDLKYKTHRKNTEVGRLKKRYVSVTAVSSVFKLNVILMTKALQHQKQLNRKKI